MWKGKVSQAIALFQQECPKRARKFLAYIEKHRHRLVDYELLQTEYQISIGSGAVESAESIFQNGMLPINRTIPE